MIVSLSESVHRRPAHIVLKGHDPDATNLVGLTLVRAIDPNYVVLELVPGTPGAAPSRVDWNEMVPAARHFVCREPSAPVDAAASPSDLAWPVARADRGDHPVTDLMTFLSAPEASSHALRQYLPIDRPLTIVVVNGWLVARRFPSDPRVTGHLLKVQKEIRVSIVLATDETPRPDYIAFDFIFSVLPTRAERRGYRIRCERAPADEVVRPGDELFTGDLAEPISREPPRPMAERPAEAPVGS